MPDLIEEVSDIIGRHHHPRPEETTNFKVVYDADQLVNLEEVLKDETRSQAELMALIEREFLTTTGRKLAQSVLLQS